MGQTSCLKLVPNLHDKRVPMCPVGETYARVEVGVRPLSLSSELAFRPATVCLWKSTAAYRNDRDQVMAVRSISLPLTRRMRHIF